MMTHTFRGKKYRVRTMPKGRRDFGDTDDPRKPNKLMRISFGNRLNDLDTQIHEALHACFWDLDEGAIDDSAGDIARFLWRIGWRKEL